MNVDTAGWELAVKLPHGALYWIEPGVVAAVPDEGTVETPELSQTVWDGYKTCADQYGGPIAALVFVDKLTDQTTEVRRFWASVMTTEVLGACSLVCESFLARAVATLFVRLSPPAVPTRLFPNTESARAWGKERLSQARDEA